MLSYFVAQIQAGLAYHLGLSGCCRERQVDGLNLACTNTNHAESRLVRQGFRKTCRKDQGEPGACRGKPAPEGLGMEDRR